MKLLRWLVYAAGLFVFTGTAWATTTTYKYTDSQSNSFNIQLFQCVSGPIYCTAMVFEDSSGNELFTSGNPAHVSQSGTWTIQPGNTPNTTPWLATINQGGNSATVTGSNALKVDGSAVTQPVSASSLPLPTGAAASANQPTNAAQGSTTSGQTGLLIQCATTTSAPTYTTAQTDPLSCDTSGNIRVAIEGGTAVNNNGPATPANSSPVTLGTTTGALLNALSTTVKSVKSSAGQFYGIQCGNTNASEGYVQVFNIASGSVTLGTSTPIFSIPIAATSTGGWMLPAPVAFGTAISVAATTTATGSSALGTALDCNAVYN